MKRKSDDRGSLKNTRKGKRRAALRLFFAFVLSTSLLLTVAMPVGLYANEIPQTAEVPQEAEAVTTPEADGEAGSVEVTPLGLPVSDLAHDVTITAGANGTLTADPASAKAGEVVHLYAHPDANCGLAVGTISVLTDSQQAIRTVRGSGTDDDPFWFTMPDDGVTVTSEFVAYREIVIADGIEHGTITVDAENNMAVKNNIVTITVTPDAGYRLKFNSTRNQSNKSLTLTDTSGGIIRYREVNG